MKEHAFRLVNNQDLKSEIENYCIVNNINTAIILSSVGSLKHLHIRLAKAENYLDIDNDFEIISLNGTISKGEAHLHVSVSDDKGECLGGHLKNGCLINTTAEIVLGELEEYESIRKEDINTGYKEIIFNRKDI